MKTATMRKRLDSALMVALVAGATACRTTRGPNSYFASGTKLLLSDSSREDFDGLSGLAGLEGGVEIADSELVGSFRGSGFIGGTARGIAGEIRGEGSIGASLQADEHRLFVRGGANAELEGNPFNGFATLELPTMLTGYAFHGNGTATFADSMHFHVGPRASLALTNAAFDGVRVLDPGVAPTVGGELSFAGEFVWVDARFAHYFAFGGDPLDVLENRACFGLFFAACVETRHVFFDKPFPESSGRTGNIGIVLGFGLATGLAYE